MPTLHSSNTDIITVIDERICESGRKKIPYFGTWLGVYGNRDVVRCAPVSEEEGLSVA